MTAIWGFALRVYAIFLTSFLNDLLQSVARVCCRDMPTLFVDARAPLDILSDAASYRIRAVTQVLENLSNQFRELDIPTGLRVQLESTIMKSRMELTIE